MAFNKISTEIIEQLKDICGSTFVFIDEQTKTNYGHDETDFYLYPPEVVVKPRAAKEISEILLLANKHHVPVTVRGAGTGLTGGALPIHGGILISMERFNEILEIDTRNLQAYRGAGCYQ